MHTHKHQPDATCSPHAHTAETVILFALVSCGKWLLLVLHGNEERACTNHHPSVRLIFVVVFLRVGVF